MKNLLAGAIALPELACVRQVNAGGRTERFLWNGHSRCSQLLAYGFVLCLALPAPSNAQIVPLLPHPSGGANIGQGPISRPHKHDRGFVVAQAGGVGSAVDTSLPANVDSNASTSDGSVPLSTFSYGELPEIIARSLAVAEGAVQNRVINAAIAHALVFALSQIPDEMARQLGNDLTADSFAAITVARMTIQGYRIVPATTSGILDIAIKIAVDVIDSLLLEHLKVDERVRQVLRDHAVAAWQAATGRYPQAIASEFIVTTKNFAQIMISAMAYSAERRAAAESRDQLARMQKDRVATNSPPQNPGDAALDCGLETSLRSEKFDRPTRVEFINKLQVVVQVFWLNYEGQRVFYNSLPPGKSYVQQTYVTHPWVATNAAGGCLSIYQPSSTPRTVILH